jgi:hypothetical protein
MGSAKRAAIAGPRHTSSRDRGKGDGARGWTESAWEAEVRSEAREDSCVAGERLLWCKKGFSKRVEEARSCGSEKEIQRDGRGRYYYPPRTPDWHSNLPKPKPLSPLSLAWHGASPCKCECSDTERSAFFTAVVSLSAVGGP